MLTLVVVPPGLGLPSLDMQCLAAIALMRHAVRSRPWELVADTEGVAAGQSGSWQYLPALWDGNLLINGFAQIMEHLRKIFDGAWDLDESLRKGDVSHCLGAVQGVEKDIRPLLSLFLYTSAENYASALRPAFASVLSFPTSWILPVQHHQIQTWLTSNMGISSSQLSSATAVLTKKPKVASKSTESLRVDPLTDEEILNPPDSAETIPMYNSPSGVLATHRQLRKLTKEALWLYDFYARTRPELLLVGERPTSAGCAIFGALALAIAASQSGLPHPWLTSALHAEFPALERMTRSFMISEWGFDFRGAQLVPGPAGSQASSLPWKDLDSSLWQKLRGLLGVSLKAAGLATSWPDFEFPGAQRPVAFEAGGIRYTSIENAAMSEKARGLGHETDRLVGVTVATAVLVLGYQAWLEGF